MLKGQCQKFLINRKCQKRLMFLQGEEALNLNIAKTDNIIPNRRRSKQDPKIHV